MIDTAQGRSGLNLAGHISMQKKAALLALPYFKGVPDPVLIKEANAKLRGMRIITDRFTAMLVIAGTRYLDHPELHVSRKA
jgi:hypothetical protein